MPTTDARSATPLQQLTQLAALLCNTPVAVLTLAGPALAAQHGGPLPAPALLRELAATLPPGAGPHTVQHAELPAFCLATPLWTEDTGSLGVLWVMATQPRSLHPDQHHALATLAAQMHGLLQLAKSEQQYRSLFEDNPMPMWVREPHSKQILAVNAAAIAHYGYSQAEFRALTSCAYTPELGESAHDVLALTDNVQALPRRHITKDGRLIDVEMSTRLVQFDGQPARIVMVHDITQRLAVKHELARLSRAQRLRTACNGAMVRADSEAELLHAICQATVDIGGYRLAWIGFAQDDAAKTVQQVAFAGDRSETVKKWPISWDADSAYGQGPAGRTIRSGEMVIVPDIYTDPWFKPFLAHYPHEGPHGVACLPLRNAQRTYGVFYLTAIEAVTLSPSEVELLQQLASDIAFGIEHLRGHTAQHEANARIHHQASLLDKAQDAIVVRGIDHKVMFWNKSAERLYGWSAAEVLGHSMVERLYPHSDNSYTAAIHTVMTQGEWHGEISQHRKDGSTMVVEARWTLVRDMHDQPYSILAVNTDITQRKEAEREVHQLAFYDLLTKLPNRQLLMDRLEHALASSARTGQGGALLFIDLDNFKTLNDTLGHDKGDLLLQQVAARLLGCVRAVDTVARLGGDEFVVMLENLGSHPHAAGSYAKNVGEKILRALSTPYQLDGKEHLSTSSIGIAPFSQQPDTVSDLLKQADIAMYQAKGAGRNTLGFFNPQLQAEVTARASLEADLRLAVALGELFLHYQTQHNAQGGMTGAEALVRWQHPQRGLVSPAAFIPLAEETGLIWELGQQVLQQACTVLAGWGRHSASAHFGVSSFSVQ